MLQSINNQLRQREKIPGLTKLLKKQGCLHPNIFWTIWLCEIHHHWNLQIVLNIKHSTMLTEYGGHELLWNSVLQGQQGMHFPGSLYYLLQCC